ncbi:transglutaminase domain-containing protein [Desmospora profundinema]|uniref:Transglutaminase-like domain-containing protein n=1 Tax=Desmospora profundinema TaxID=1571184 RepID=A0ABU1IR05_9BACL|nr:transglutaminase domain-containing protein [Desmospora profundinema]MDR6227209.1 hypothetical protein [Desmospora profundinema]
MPLHHAIVPGQTVSDRFLQLGIVDFQYAAKYVQQLPYGRTSHHPDYMEVLTEKKGTCSTKHAILAVLAEELKLPVAFVIGIYRMSERNTPGVGAVLEKVDPSYIPEAHCYLKIEGRRYDFTREADSFESPFESLLYEEEIKPDQLGDYKVSLHRDFIHRWAKTEGLEMDLESLWEMREACIQALSSD